MGYIISLFIFLTIYVFLVKNIKFTSNVCLVNAIFFTLIYLPYLALVLVVYFDVGPYDWNFLNTLPTANVSPFCFFTLPAVMLLPKKIKKYFLLLYSLLTVGMFLSPTLGIIDCIIKGTKFHLHFQLNYLSHYALSLFGIYLIKSKQIQLNLKDALISCFIIIGVCFVMIILNLIFDTAFFGLSFTGKHNIYNNVLVNNPYLSALIYFTGLIFVLSSSFILNKLLNLNPNNKTKTR